MSKSTNVLILCTHNSARSILAEAMLNHLAKVLNKPVVAYSAGSSPKTVPNPLAIDVLQQVGIDTQYLHSKSWDVFANREIHNGGDAIAPPPAMDIVITVCDSAASEACPLWPGAPVQVHWGFPDPSNAPGDNQAKLTAFELTRQAIAYKMLQLLHLPLAEQNAVQLKVALNAIAAS